MNFNIQRPLAEMRDALSLYRLGSPRTRKGYYSVLTRVIKDLFYLKSPFNTFKEVNFEKIKYLIEHWKNNNIKNVTIGSRLSIVRKYTNLLNHDLAIPDNKSLGLTRIKNKIKLIQPLPYDDFLKKIQNSFVRLAINLQVFFGLTKNEALQFRIQIYEGTIKRCFIAKLISHDNKDRFIEIRFPEQELIINELANVIDSKLSLSNKYGLQLMSRLYASELHFVECPNNYPFRFIYAKKLFNYFLQHENISNKDALNKVALEMGIIDKRIMKKWINYE